MAELPKRNKLDQCSWTREDEKLREFDEDIPDLRSLVIPWASMVIVAVIAAGFVLYHNHCDGEHSEDQLFFQSSDTMVEGSSYKESILERFLSGVTVEQHHVHKPVYEENHPSLFPLTTADRLGFSFVIIGLMVAAGGGIGGGGILVPIYILIMGFSPKHAIPLSNITVFGGAIANMILNVEKRHPLADRPLIDWDLILVMEPLTIGGALLGAFLNKLLPEVLLTIMLVILLSFTAYTSLKKAVKMYKAESRVLREQGLKPDGTKESELTHINHQVEATDTNKAGDELLKDMDLQEGESPGTGDMESLAADKADELQKILDEERVTPMYNVSLLVGLFVFIISINMAKGGGAFPSPIGIKCGTYSFWMANGIMLGTIFLFCVYVRAYLVERFKAKERCGYKYVHGDIQWDSRATIVYPCICCLAGFFAGMFGVGGGIVKGPLMLAMEVHPAVASASSACMILFTSFTATTSFFVFGLLDPQYAPVCFGIGFIATYFGQIGLSILMKRSQRNSYIAFSIGGGVALSAVLMTIQSVLSLAEGEQHKSGGICGKDS
ncbi:sulfite exporter TauE/SafE [Nitzschia inconspicua]|uniref:Sulfite exporter TauE/SafE n=1 Tax=Nitzschia inconspicua TaxID=303405 RepID=A0A9K3LF08_9STRA|nr:sulfite exporter TauE/SafE [Nitzschia inconspicua]